MAELKAETTNEPSPVRPVLQSVLFASATQILTNLGGGTESVIVARDFRECWLGIRMETMV